MPLVLTISSGEGAQLGSNAVKIFDRSSGVVGRGAQADWTLPDASGLTMSQRHFRVDYRDEAYFVTDLSLNGTFLNDADQPIGKDLTVKLVSGDVLHIGYYRIDVHIEDEVAEPPPVRSLVEVDQPSAPADLGGIIASELDPLELLGGPPAASKPRSPGATSDHSPITSDPIELPRAGAEAIPDDWNPFGDALPVDTPGAESPPAGVSHQPIPDDWDPLEQVPPAESPVRETSSVGPSVGEDALLAAFLRGAGVDESALGCMSPEELMELVGRLFRDTVSNLRDLLMARSNVKGGLRLDVTTIQPRENNPLKFSVGDADEIIRNLFDQRGSGYLGAQEAFDEAFGDIKDHEIGIIAGMRATFDGLLERFDPERLEEQFSKAGGFSLSKKALFWGAYRNFYKELKRDVEDGSQLLSGSDFQKAYLKQVRDR